MAVILKAIHTVKPAKPTPNKTLNLSECDQIMSITHTPTIYFYGPTEFPFDSATETLKTSLSQALVHFYPLAGRLNWIDRDRFELECNAAGAELYEVESDATVADFGGDNNFAPTAEIRKLIPMVDYKTTPMHEIPLMLAQLTKFRCGGFGFGLLTSHLVVDGTSALHFVAEWARIARGEPLILSPFFDRTAWETFGDEPTTTTPRFHHAEYSSLPLLIGEADDENERTKETTVSMLKLTISQLQILKKQANKCAGGGVGYNNGRSFSRYEALAAHAWRCACKARGLESEQPTELRSSVNVRNRLCPPLPDGYFGNAVSLTSTISHAEEVVSMPLGYTASRIRGAIDKMTDKYIRSACQFLRAQPELSKFRQSHSVGCSKSNFLGNPNFFVTSWIGLDIHGADFGWGKEIYVGPGSLVNDGRCIILSSPDGDGSLLVALRLQVAYMDSFKKFFYEDIDEQRVVLGEVENGKDESCPMR